eukprot:931087-Pyramimonas_sp.AAC.1
METPEDKRCIESDDEATLEELDNDSIREERAQWEKEEADVQEGEVHTVLPNDLEDEKGDPEEEYNKHFREYVQQLECTKRTHETNIVLGTCTCPDREVVGFVCKHLFRALELSGKDINSLPRHVTEAPHLTLDHEALERGGDVMDGVIQSDCGEDEGGDEDISTTAGPSGGGDGE